MKRYSFILLVLITGFFLSSCDDSGTLPPNTPRGLINFTQKNLRTLNPDVDGVYELWIRLDSATGQEFQSLGRFNIGGNNSIVDLDGSPKTFKYDGDTNRLYLTTTAIVSIEKGGFNTFPSPSRIISTNMTVTRDSIYGKLSMSGSDAFGSVGSNMFTAPRGLYTLQTPSGSPSDCYKGLWFCSATGDTATMPEGLALTPGKGWVYQAWVADTSQPGNFYYYSIGRFYDPRYTDNDSTGPCGGPNPSYNKPGQDWIQPNCIPGKPDIISLASGFYQVFITIEPEDEVIGSQAYETPFFFRLFWQSIIVTSVGCNRPDNIYNWAKAYGLFPEGRLVIAN
jgi:hypothetical protein